jgi:hypothetical protein
MADEVGDFKWLSAPWRVGYGQVISNLPINARGIGRRYFFLTLIQVLVEDIFKDGFQIHHLPPARRDYAACVGDAIERFHTGGSGEIEQK